VPQLAVAGHIEQKLNGDALERAGVGRVVGISQPETRLEPGELQSLIDDDAMAARAAALGKHLRSIMTGRDTLTHCESVCMELLRASNP
jgi:UDP:flavonoid glycosyltransferase YjiC (YdhE family)